MKSIFCTVNEFITQAYSKDTAFQYDTYSSPYLPLVVSIHKYDYKKFNNLLDLIPDIDINKINQFISLVNILKFIESNHFESYIYIDVWEDKITISLKPCFEIFISIYNIFIKINGRKYNIDEFNQNYDIFYMDALKSHTNQYSKLSTINNKNISHFCNLDIRMIIQENFKANSFSGIDIDLFYKNAEEYISNEYKITLIKGHSFDVIINILKKSKVSFNGINQFKTLVTFLEIVDCFVLNHSKKPFTNNIEYVVSQYKSKLLDSYNLFVVEGTSSKYRLAINTSASLFTLAYITDNSENVILHGYDNIYEFLKTLLIEDMSKTLDVNSIYLSSKDLSLYNIMKYQ